MGRGRILSVVALVAALGACAPQIRDYGYAPAPSELKDFKVGSTTQDDVAKAIGYPATRGMMKDDAWYYIASRQKTVAFFAPRITARQIVEIAFNTDGTVHNITRYGLKDGRVIVLNRRVTEDTTKGITFLQQAFRNLGRFSASDVTNGQ